MIEPKSDVHTKQKLPYVVWEVNAYSFCEAYASDGPEGAVPDWGKPWGNTWRDLLRYRMTSIYNKSVNEFGAPVVITEFGMDQRQPNWDAWYRDFLDALYDTETRVGQVGYLDWRYTYKSEPELGSSPRKPDGTDTPLIPILQNYTYSPT